MEGHDMMNHNMMDHSNMGHDMPGHQMPGHNMPEHDMPGHEMPSSCSMNMLFNWQIKNVCVVFESWHIHSAMGMLISCIVVFCIAAGYEYLRVWSSALDERQLDKKKRHLIGEDSDEDTNFLRKDTLKQSHRLRVLKSVNYAILVAISFWLMLVFMTYNGYLMISTVLGAGFGHFIFGQGKLKAARDIQCH